MESTIAARAARLNHMAHGTSFVVALAAAGVYGATLEAYPIFLDAMVVPAAIGLVVAIVTGAVFARRLGAGTVGLLVATWIAVLGSVVWMPLDGRAAPVTRDTIVDWLLVHLSWPSVLALAAALACVLAAGRLEPSRRAVLRVVAVWLAAHLAAEAIEHGGARWEASPRIGAATSLAVYAAAAAASAALARTADLASVPAAFVPCALVLALGPPAIIRGALDRPLDTGAALAELIESEELDPWLVDCDYGVLPPDDVLVVLASGRRLAVHRGHTRVLAPEEVWAPAASEQVARIVPARGVTAGQLIDALGRVGTQRVDFATIQHTPTLAPLAAVSVRAAIERVVLIPIWLVPNPPLAGIPCVDLLALPPDEPLEPHVRSTTCVANARVGEVVAPPAGPPPRPWLPSLPSRPRLVLLAGSSVLAIMLRRSARRRSLARRRAAARPLRAAVLTSVAILAGAAVLRVLTDA